LPNKSRKQQQILWLKKIEIVAKKKNVLTKIQESRMVRWRYVCLKILSRFPKTISSGQYQYIKTSKYQYIKIYTYIRSCKNNN